MATIDGEPEEIDTLGVVNIANMEEHDVMVKFDPQWCTWHRVDETEFDGQVLQGYLEGSM